MGSSYSPLWPNSFNRSLTWIVFQSFLNGWWVCAQWKSEEFTEYNIWLGAPPANSSSVLFKKIKINQSCLACWSQMMKCMSLCGNKMPTRCNRGFYCRSYCLLNMFRAPLCPSSGALDYYTVVAACGISCCGFQVAGLVWSWGLCVHILTTMHGQNHIKFIHIS